MTERNSTLDSATRRQFMGGAAALGAASAARSPSAARGRPNVLFIVSDQWSPLAAGLDGANRTLRTPAADSIAAGGMRFDNAYCSFPLCSPSRASLLMGRMPHECGVMFNFQGSDRGGAIPESTPRLGDLFSEAGYDTGYFGKEHLDGAGYRGFRERGSLEYPGAGAVADGSALDPVFVRDALGFIRARRDKPFLAVVSLINPHDICYVPSGPVSPEKKTMVGITTAFSPSYWRAGENGPKGKYLRGLDLPPLRPNFNAVSPLSRRRPWTEEEYRTYLATYYLLIENTDWHIGCLLGALREAGIEKNTLVLFTADHGEQMGSHQLIGKMVFYEEAARVPLAISWPGVIRPGQVSRGLVSGIDVLPTLCNYVGARIPSGVTGRSLRPLVEQASAPWRGSLVSETETARMLRYGRHKYIRYKPARHLEMLFDLENDPGETRNLAEDPGHNSELEDHRKMLDAWMAHSGGSFEQVETEIEKWLGAR
jgi:arylsulfatase A-like enzyme